MTKVSKTDTSRFKLTRDFVANYQSGNVILNTIFKPYDKDGNLRFNDEEWSNYCNDVLVREQRKQLITNVNKNTTKFYNEKLVKLAAAYTPLKDELITIDSTAWDELLAFEEEHPEVKRVGLSKGQSLPKGAMKYDLSTFGMGIYDKEKESYTGECYQEGFISGLETLSSEERKKYLELLDRAKSSAKKWIEFEKKCKEIDTEFENYKKLSDFANHGFIQDVVSREKAEKLIEIYDNANPFLAKIKELELMRQQLWLKGNKTVDENKLIEQYDIQIQQLKEASSQWSISDADENILELLKKEGFSAQFTPLNINNQNAGLTNTISAAFNYNSDNLMVQGNISGTFGMNVNKEFINTHLGSLNIGYYRDKFSLLSESSYNNQDSMSSFNQQFTLSRNNFSANIGESITTSTPEGSNREVTTHTTTLGACYNTENSSINVSGSITPDKEIYLTDTSGKTIIKNSTAYTAGVNLTQTIGRVQNNVNVNLSSEGNTYSLSSSNNLQKDLGKYFKLESAQSLTSTYNQAANQFNINPILNAKLSYKKKDLTAQIELTEQFNTTLANGYHPLHNHNFTTSGELSFKGFKGRMNYNNTDSPYDHSNTYGGEISYETNRFGQVGVECSYQKSETKAEPITNEDLSVSVKYSLKF